MSESIETRAAFTLVELLVVIGIIALLVAILLPSLAKARAQAASVKCLSNLRQLGQSAFAYAAENKGAFPLAYWDYNNDGAPDASWDLIIDTGPPRVVRPGILFGWRGGNAVTQCPAYDRSIPGGDEFTGYNYNTSYIGGRFTFGGSDFHPSAKVGQIRAASRKALFGDGEYASGPNKYMRSPLPSADDPASAEVHASGGQGFRHHGATNVVFADGHAQTITIRINDRLPTTGIWSSNALLRILAGKNNGFLSQDNSAYELK